MKPQVKHSQTSTAWDYFPIRISGSFGDDKEMLWLLQWQIFAPGTHLTSEFQNYMDSQAIMNTKHSLNRSVAVLSLVGAEKRMVPALKKTC